MFITLNASDIQRLSPECRAELMSIMMSPTVGPLDAVDPYPEESFQDFVPYESTDTPPEDATDNKKVVVVDITVDQARDLIANISEKNDGTLRLFATGQWIPLTSLIGADGIYGDYSNLKRSFVGAINRRLRTVCGNRNAVLFKSDSTKTMIKTRPLTALALRCAFGIPEPMPELEFWNRGGQSLDGSSKDCEDLKDKLNTVWMNVAGRPNDGNPVSWPERVFSEFAKAGLSFFMMDSDVVGDMELELSFYNIDYSEVRQKEFAGVGNSWYHWCVGASVDAPVFVRPHIERVFGNL